MFENASIYSCIFLGGTTIALWLRLRSLHSRGKKTASTNIESKPSQVPQPNGLPASEILSGLLDTLGEACIVYDEQQKITFANDAASKISGGLVPRPGSSLRSIVNDHKILDLAIEAVASGRATEREFELINGTSRFLQCSAAPIALSGESKKMRYFSLVVRDASAERETEQIRKDFVANASHELRTPLSIINGYLENFLDGMIEPGEEATRALRTMSRHSERIARIVEDMLTISQFESKGSESLRALRSQTFDLEACALDVIDRLAPVIEENKTSIETDIPSSASVFAGDRGYWDQVLFNLVDNAIKENTTSSIKITIAARVLPDRSHQISVSDNGVGIPAAHIPFVFKRFYRVAKHHSNSKIKGTGLGLSIVKRAVEAHGGTITLSSTPGIETKFSISVPPIENDGIEAK